MGNLVREWRLALRSYERQRGFTLDGRIEVELDELGRISRLQSRLD